MDTISAGEVARRLGTNVPRVKRAIDRLGIAVERGGGGRVRVDEQQLEALGETLGVVPPARGLSRIETQVLAALARAPRGLASSRAVGRRAGVSPTAAAASIASLIDHGLVRRTREWAAAGRARELDVIRAEVTAPAWPVFAPHLARVRLPVRRTNGRPARVPVRLRHLFWNADTGELDIDAHGAYIAERLLSTGDLDGLAWGLHALSASDWEQAARNRGLSTRQRALARNLASRTTQ